MWTISSELTNKNLSYEEKNASFNFDRITDNFEIKLAEKLPLLA